MSEEFCFHGCFGCRGMYDAKTDKILIRLDLFKNASIKSLIETINHEHLHRTLMHLEGEEVCRSLDLVDIFIQSALDKRHAKQLPRFWNKPLVAKAVKILKEKREVER